MAYFQEEFAAAAISSDYETERGKPMPSKNHAIIQGNLHFNLRKKYEGKYSFLPEIKLNLPIKDRVPDLAIYPPMDYVRGADEIRMKQPPLGVIEILSPQQNVTELMQKRGEYFLAGVKSHWIVVPDLDTIYVFYSPDDYDVYFKKDVVHDKALGIEIALADIFK